nr:photosystem I protein M [Pinus tabuliformis]
MEELKFLIAFFLAFIVGLLLAIKLGQALYDC